MNRSASQGSHVSGRTTKHSEKVKCCRVTHGRVKPLGIEFTLLNLKGILTFNDELAHKLADGLISRDRSGAFNGIIANQLKAFTGHDSNINVNVKTPEIDYDRLVQSMSKESQRIVSRAIMELELQAKSSAR